MALILSIESSAMNFSVAVHQNGICLGIQKSMMPKMAAAQLAPAIEQLLNSLSIKFNQLNAIALSEGPGSYTGLRIGSSTAKGLCMSLNLPLIAVNTLRAMAWPFRNNKQYQFFLPALDARRDEIYCMVLDKEFQEIKATSAMVICQDSFGEFLNEGATLFIGSGSEKCLRIINHPNASADSLAIPDATAIGELAWTYFLNQEFVPVAGFEPLYLKEFLVGTKLKS
jgi:tRNA threonylcarbamoyladenosine biosynthesis protein TsaB